MRRLALIAVAVVAVVLVSAALIKRFGDTSSSDPSASVANGAPRGLLGLALLLADAKRAPVVLSRFEDALPQPDGGAPFTFLVPPPERSGWTEAEVKALLDRVNAGDHLVIACDDEQPRNDRLKPLLDALGVECVRADVAIGDESVTKGVGLWGTSSRTLQVRGTGRVRPKANVAAYPAWMAGNESVVVRVPVGAGVVTVLGSATPFANDGLANADNAAFALDELRGTVVVDERHHASRSRASIANAAARGPGPFTALALLALLIPLSALSLAPRPGDPPRDDEGRAGAPAALAQARALAALLAHVDGKRAERDRR